MKLTKILTIENTPEDLDSYFARFVDELTKVEMWNKGTKTTFIETGPRENYGSTFEVLPMQFPFTFNVNFAPEGDKVDIFFESFLDTSDASGMMKMAAKMFKKMGDKVYSKQIIQFIIASIQKASIAAPTSPAQSGEGAKFCGNCGSPVSPGNRFCTNCGKPVQ